MKPEDIIELKIDSIAFGGAGVGRINDFVVFVPFTLEGEVVKARVLKVKSNYAEAAPVEILSASPDRIQPRCPYFGQCGGCVYQHMPYEKQTELKTRQVREVYRQLTGNDMQAIEETCPSPKPYHYRTKIRMKMKMSKYGTRCGFFDYYDNILLDMEECPIAAENLNQHLKKIRQDNFAFFRERNTRSWNYAFIDAAEGIIDNLGPNLETKVTVGGKTFYYSRDSFFQINHSIFTPLFETIHELLQRENIHFDSFLDLYCGVGFFGVVLSDHFKKVYFIEENKASYKLLLKNIEANGIASKSFPICATADKAVKMLSAEPEVILMDPPRSGSTPESIQQIVSMNPSCVIYISCNPATQFRDALIFEKSGFKLCYAKPFDFFPQTKHIECMAIFKKI